VKKLKLIALIAAIITALLLYLFLNSIKSSPQTDVLKAVVNIPSNTKVTAEMVTVAKISKDAIHPDAIKDPEMAVGKATQSDILTGEQILSAKLVSPGEGSNNSLAYAIKPGMRAITVTVNERTGLSGMLKPQDHVDIISEFDNAESISYTTLVVENVTILAVDSVMGKEGKAVGKDGLAIPYVTLTLQVTPQEAMTLSMTEYKGHLRALLRSPLDSKLTNLPSITFDSIMVK
jgi:pilus assembly protein CpaB